MINPINKDFKSRLVEKIPSGKIIKQYQNDFKIDVSRFFKGMDFVQIYECEVTKYRFYFPFSLMGDSKFYIDLSERKKNYYHERWEHNISINHARNGESWLEVGSGNSFFLKKLVKRGVSALGLELNSDEVQRAKNEKFDVQDCDFFSFVPPKKGYDAIASFQVLEHIKDVSNFFIKAGEMLKKQGKLIIGVPNNNPYLYVFDKYHTLNFPPHHMGLWTGQSLKRVGREFGFEVIDLQYEPISQSELDYILSLFSFNQISVKNFKFLVLKFLKKYAPSKVYQVVSRYYRKSLVKGRNVLIVLEKVQ